MSNQPDVCHWRWTYLEAAPRVPGAWCPRHPWVIGVTPGPSPEPPPATLCPGVTRSDMWSVFDDVQDGEHNIYAEKTPTCYFLCLLYYSTFFKERKIAAQNTVLTHSEHCQTWLMSRMSHSARAWAGLQWPAPEPTARIMKQRLCVPPPAPLASWSLGASSPVADG